MSAIVLLLLTGCGGEKSCVLTATCPSTENAAAPGDAGNGGAAGSPTTDPTTTVPSATPTGATTTPTPTPDPSGDPDNPDAPVDMFPDAGGTPDADVPPNDECMDCDCEGDDQCMSPYPVCNTDLNNCVACVAADNRGCSGTTGLCKAGTTELENECVECLGGADCSEELPICQGNACAVCSAEDHTGCAEESYCKAGGTPAENECVACIADEHCGAGVCLDNHCTPCDPEDDAGCAADELCEPGSTPNQNRCVQCLTDDQCGDQLCIDGECRGSCMPGEQVCDSNAIRLCSQLGDFGAPQACGQQKECSESNAQARCLTVCQPGQLMRTDATATADRVCAPCPSDSFSTVTNAAECTPAKTCAPGWRVAAAGSATKDRECSRCSNGNFSTGTNTATCTAWSDCEAGTRIANNGAGSPTADRECVDCTSGFTSGNNETVCRQWQTCGAGEYQVRNGTPTRNRECKGCETGFTTGNNETECRNWDTCQPGERQTRAPSASRNRECASCGNGEYSEQQNATSCLTQPTCAKGTRARGGSKSQKRTCEACGAGTYSDKENAAECSSWKTCQPGERQTSPPSSTSNRSCANCANGEYSDEQNAASCTKQPTCAKGTRVSGGGSKTQRRSCEPCGSNTFSDKENSATCSPLRNCSAGQFATGGSSTSNRTCSPCPNGTFSTTANAGACTPYTRNCAAGTFVKNGNSKTADRECQVCPFGTVSTSTNATECRKSQVVAGGQFTCVLLPNGKVKCWGNSEDARLGQGKFTGDIGDNEPPSDLAPIQLGANASQLSAGLSHTCALLSGDKAICWGGNAVGELGNGSFEEIGDDETPASRGALNVGSPVASIAAGFSHACALLKSGDVVCWGSNTSNQLGVTSGSTNDAGSATKVNLSGKKAIQIGAGGFHTCAVLTGGAVKCWGSGRDGQLGYGNTNNVASPADVGNVNIGGIAMQIVAGWNHTCALLANGQVRCWGNNDSGQLGLGHTRTIGDGEAPNSEGVVLTDVVQLSAYKSHTCALRNTGAVRCWGENNERQTGYAKFTNDQSVGNNERASSLQNLVIGGRATSVAAGDTHSCALLASGQLRCWGSGFRGELGYGKSISFSSNNSQTPADLGNVPYQ